MCIYEQQEEEGEDVSCLLLLHIEKEIRTRQQETHISLLIYAYQMSGSGVYNGLLG